ncbi:hypothetical protein L1049_009696 [Liquidambar formosana]|uniref:Stigma-specific STIG1-like protein 1 n=1 Tax=Liquidambar formosana TaxID=63359 RepID=A0AAP0N676_LIQFO
MESSKILFILLVVMSIAITLSATPTHDEELQVDIKEPYFLRGTGRFLAETPRVVMTCDKYPTVCRAKGSAGPDCCKKQCVNVMTDKLNCGKCGKKCGYSEVCCQGACVNPSVDKKHCGKCNNKCMNGSSCTYGLCSYA